MNRIIPLLVLGLILIPFILIYFWFFEPRNADLYLVYLINVTWLILLIGFILFTYISGSIPKSKRNLWAALLVTGNVVVFPFFWYFYIWKLSDKNA
jgi:hypothetical protein